MAREYITSPAYRNFAPPGDDSAGAKAKKKKARVRDQNKPKGPVNAFVLYKSDVYKSDVWRKAKAADPNFAPRVAEASKLIGHMWKGLSKAEKAKYEAKAKADSLRYEKEKEKDIYQRQKA